MKKLLLATLIAAAFSANAEPVDFSYAQDAVNFYGLSDTPQTYDVAIFLPGDEFEGCKVTAIKVPVYAASGIDNYASPKVWLSSKLALSDGSNNADIASYDVEITSDGSLGYINHSLPQEYTITQSGVYVGYSFTVTALDESTTYPFALCSGSNSNSLFIHGSKSLTNWTNVNASDGLSSALTVALENVNLPESNVSFVSAPATFLAAVGKPGIIPVTLNTSANKSVTSLDFECVLAGNSYTCHYDLPTAVPASYGENFSANVEIPALDDKLLENVTLKVVKVNGVENVSESNVATLQYGVVAWVPEHQSLMEEFTCTKCGYCTRGYAALEYIKENYPEFICVSYHNNMQGTDPMTVTSNYPVSVPGNPSAALNRTLVGIDPYYGTESYNSILPVVGDIMAQNALSTPWDIKLSHKWIDDDNIVADVEVANVLGFESGNYKIGYLLVCDGLSGTGSSWLQTNYYNSYSPSEQYIPQLNNFCSGGIYGKRSVKDLVYNDVVISVDGYTGVRNSIPSALEAEAWTSHSQTWDLSKIKSTLLPDKNKLRIVAFVLDKYGEVLNCVKEDVKDFGMTGVDNVNVENADAPVEYYNLSGVKVSNPSNGIFIRRQGGKAEKVVIR